MKFINPNKVYWVRNRDLKIKRNPEFGHHVLITWYNPELNLCRVKTITSLEHEDVNGNLYYDFQALKEAKNGYIEPISIKKLKTKHRSGILNKSIVISLSKLRKDYSGFMKPKRLIKKKSL